MQKLLNKIPVLDNGYVAMYSASMTRDEFVEVQRLFFRGRVDSRLTNMPKIHLVIKCPLFVQLSLTETQLTAVSQPLGRVEAYVPTVAEVCARDLSTSEDIQRDIEQTSKALILNPKAYQLDGCDVFVSQVNSPISVYNVLMVSGSLGQWIEYVNREGFPGPIEAYRKAINELLLSEWDIVWEQINGQKSKRK